MREKSICIGDLKLYPTHPVPTRKYAVNTLLSEILNDTANRENVEVLSVLAFCSKLYLAPGTRRAACVFAGVVLSL